MLDANLPMTPLKYVIITIFGGSVVPVAMGIQMLGKNAAYGWLRSASSPIGYGMVSYRIGYCTTEVKMTRQVQNSSTVLTWSRCLDLNAQISKSNVCDVLVRSWPSLLLLLLAPDKWRYSKRHGKRWNQAKQEGLCLCVMRPSQPHAGIPYRGIDTRIEHLEGHNGEQCLLRTTGC